MLHSGCDLAYAPCEKCSIAFPFMETEHSILLMPHIKSSYLQRQYSEIRLKGLAVCPYAHEKTCLCALTWLPGILHGVADVGPAADGALHHDGAGQQRRSMDPPRLTATQVDVRLGLLVLA